MTADELTAILDKHGKWLRGKEGGERANLNRAYLNRAYLNRANLSDAYLSRANLGGAYLNRAYLSDAYLSGANLSGADLSGANLSDTCLDPGLLSLSREFCRACPPVGKHGGRVVYRTEFSRHVGNTKYAPGHTYTAPVLSWDAATACHPGIYAASLEWMQREYTDVRLVRCYVRDGEWTITAKGAIRCHKVRVLEYVPEATK